MKQSKQCPKCGSKELIHILRAINSSRYNAESICSLSIEGTELAGAALGLAPDALEAYTCRKCGFFELYVREPGSIDLSRETVKEI